MSITSIQVGDKQHQMLKDLQELWSKDRRISMKETADRIINMVHEMNLQKIVQIQAIKNEELVRIKEEYERQIREAVKKANERKANEV